MVSILVCAARGRESAVNKTTISILRIRRLLLGDGVRSRNVCTSIQFRSLGYIVLINGAAALILKTLMMKRRGTGGDVRWNDASSLPKLAPPVAEEAMKRVIIALAALVMAIPAVAQDTDGLGAGTINCSQITAERDDQ